jgi:hypothetical protein
MSDRELLKQYRDAVAQPPEKGYILQTMDGSPVALNVQLESRKPPFIFGRAYLSEILDHNLGWYARGVDDDKIVGWKCVLMTQARRAVVQRCGDQLAEGKISVKSLKVVRPSESGMALLCEVHEFVQPEPESVSASQRLGSRTLAQNVVPQLPDSDQSLADLCASIVAQPDEVSADATGSGEKAAEEPPVC